ncbi:hypothetical protein LPY66_18180 [Dehalobacter sp. DCM]|uniref:hypothetical protein n=1 Tax=Dehalobacter sp. DCM TaxID=2907827 RepID=UPI00308181B7|nr:hypothetical protein LPY66_18180 [Dehalobacter sp. DCM]
MDFEQGLKTELSSITGLDNKVFEIAAPKGTSVPYLIYTLGAIERVKTLDGYAGLVHAQYQVDVFHTEVSSLRTLKKAVTDKLETLDFRQIGGSGPYIQQSEITDDGKVFEDQVNFYKGTISLSADYEE